MSLILAIDTSCDDTSVAVLRDDCVLSSIVSSQMDIHKQWGGVVPNLARRAHEERIDYCIELALKRAGIKLEKIDAIAVTYGPGLAPALEVGVRKAKELALRHNKKLIAVNHMEGHLVSPFLKTRYGDYYGKNVTDPRFPLLSLCVSGGHTELVRVEWWGKYKIIGQTLDDAAGEAFDKVGRMLELGYPGGPVIEFLALKGDREKYPLPRPMEWSQDYNFSFSGLKTACLYSIQKIKQELEARFHEIIPDFCASFQEAVVDSLLIKLERAVNNLQPKMVLVSGGVSVNKRLRRKCQSRFRKLGVPLYFPHKKFCMDNAAMIGLAGYYKYQRGEFIQNVNTLDRRPSITIEYSSVE
ncbi:MAG: tRNA (adenosine(37)-N6)-threonylcarbamoyltransferase complex transferase subunit TsaD [Parcubacteria group bacterium]|nr:tRNA (adenosine(37)-N6)-threonylcarbamoyltransferase complex transferase subunit TsaD [Parcubacteria group bacterium]